MIAGEISLACFPTLAPRFVPALVSSFKQQYPEVAMQLHLVPQHELVDGLRDGKYDLGICYSYGLPQTIEHAGLTPDLYPQAVLSENHRFADREMLSLSMLADDPFVLLDIWPSNEYFLGIFQSSGIQPKVTYKVPSIDLVRGLVGFDLGYSILVTQHDDFRTLTGRRILTVPLKDAMHPSRMVMAWQGSNELTTLTRTFLHHCQHEMSKHVLPRGYSKSAATLEPNAKKPSRGK